MAAIENTTPNGTAPTAPTGAKPDSKPKQKTAPASDAAAQDLAKEFTTLTRTQITRDPARNVRSLYPDIDVLAAALKREGQNKAIDVMLMPNGEYHLQNGYRRMLAFDALDYNGPIIVRVRTFADEGVALLNNLADNTGQATVRTYDFAKRCAELEEKYSVKRKRIADSCHCTDKYVGLLIRCFTKLHPTILEAWANPAAQTEIPVQVLAQWVTLEHDAQLQRFEEYMGPEETGDESDGTDGSTGGDTDGDDDTPQAARPGKKAIEAQLAALREKMKEDPANENFRAYIKALRWALGEVKRLA